MVAAIRGRQAARNSSFLDQLEAKYVPEGGEKKAKKQKK